MMTVWMMGIATACIGLLLVQPDRLVGAGAAGVPASGSGFAVGGEWGGAALLGGECPREKAFTAAGCRWATASASCSTGLVSLISSLTSDQQFLSWGWRLPFLFSVVLVLVRCGSATAWRNRRSLKRSRARQRAADEKRLPVVKRCFAIRERFTDYRPAAV